MNTRRMPSRYLSKDSTELLRAASKARRDGDVEGAIKLLKWACEVMDIERGGGMSPLLRFGPEPFLRLPMYLQEAGRPEEAWSACGRTKRRCARELPAHQAPLFVSAIESKQCLYLQ